MAPLMTTSYCPQLTTVSLMTTPYCPWLSMIPLMTAPYCPQLSIAPLMTAPYCPQLSMAPINDPSILSLFIHNLINDQPHIVHGCPYLINEKVGFIHCFVHPH